MRSCEVSGHERPLCDQANRNTSSDHLNAAGGEEVEENDEGEDDSTCLDPTHLLRLGHPRFFHPAKQTAAGMGATRVAVGLFEGIVGDLLRRQRDRRSPHEARGTGERSKAGAAIVAHGRDGKRKRRRKREDETA